MKNFSIQYKSRNYNGFINEPQYTPVSADTAEDARLYLLSECPDLCEADIYEVIEF